MEIQRIGKNKIRCALTETEIRDMGFEIDDIISNTETTQRFMRLIMEILEEEEHISMDNIAPMVKAELLQDHTMAITFGDDSNLALQSLVDTVSQMIERYTSHLEEKAPEKKSFLGNVMQDTENADDTENAEKEAKQSAEKPMVCAIAFDRMNNLLEMVHVCFDETFPISSLYRMDDRYYLIMDFAGWKKETMRTFAFGTMEYDSAHFSEKSQIAYITEHGTCIIPDKAIEMLRQL
jgi:adapter protein MecA 1/2